jgi:hypothetical protein
MLLSELTSSTIIYSLRNTLSIMKTNHYYFPSSSSSASSSSSSSIPVAPTWSIGQP